MRLDNQNNRKIAKEVLFIGILILFIIFAFFLFTKRNNERIFRQNENYIQNLTLQVSERVEDILDSSRKNIRVIAYMYGNLLESSEVNEETLRELQDISVFNYIEFADINGLNRDAEGTVTDVSDQEYYIEGMKGNRGSLVTARSANTDEAMLLFYVPVRIHGEIVGVLNGIFGEEGMRNILETEIFDTQAKNYLCMSDGTVVFSCGDENAPENILEEMPETMKVTGEVYAQIKETFAEHSSLGFHYTGTQGTGNAYMIGIAESDWMLIQSFPSSVTKNMTDEANAVGIQLELQLVAAFGIYIVCLMLVKWKQKKKLVMEKQEMSQVVTVATQLFNRFVLVDLKQDTYEYLGGKEEGLPQEGKYTELVEHFGQLYIKEEEREDMAEVITADYIRKHLKKNIPYLQYEYRIQREGQNWENMAILCLKRESGMPEMVLLAIQDVTALKENELYDRIALKEAFEAADEANHAKSDFLSRMSHDLRTPMNAIMGMTAVAVMHIDDRERLMDCLNKINLSSRHLLALINDVLDMSKIESGKISLSEKEFEMSRAVDSLLAIIYPQMEAKKQQLKVNVAKITHERVIGDPLRLQQVFVNIMGNAVKFTPEGGSIIFSIREKPSRIKGSGCYEFVFEDTGIGMKQEFIEKIYEPFSRAENASKQNIEGTGLGMSIARNIVRMMNGDIQIESKLGVGSRFTVTIYLKLQDVEEESAEYLKELRVLVADDEQDACENTCEILQSIGMHADGVYSGYEAIEKLHNARENAEDYVVVILDWKMPGKCGVETAKQIRRELGDDVPTIILSAYDWSAIEQEAREAGVDAFIAKPLFKSRLLYVLKSIVGLQKEEKASDVKALKQSDYSGRKVLLVEDNELNIEIAEELLSYIGIKVEKARDGQQAVDILLDRPEHYYDLVFMDIQMPVKNGYEATREIRASGREDLETIPIVAMSADAFTDDIQKAMVAGMNDHVAKPIELPKLLAALEKWMK